MTLRRAVRHSPFQNDSEALEARSWPSGAMSIQASETPMESFWAGAFAARWSERVLLNDPQAVDKTHHLMYQNFILSIYRDGTFKLRVRNSGTDEKYIESIKSLVRDVTTENHNES